MSYRVDKLVIDTQTDTHTDAGNDNTRRPKLASGKNLSVVMHGLFFDAHTLYRSIRPIDWKRFCVFIMSATAKSVLFEKEFLKFLPRRSRTLGDPQTVAMPFPFLIFVSCQTAPWFGWFQQRIHHVLPYGHPRWWPFKRSGLSWGVK